VSLERRGGGNKDSERVKLIKVRSTSCSQPQTDEAINHCCKSLIRVRGGQ